MAEKWFQYCRDGNSLKVRTAPVTRTGGKINIPKSSDWTYRGVVLSGGSGWDKRLEGALSPCTVVKKGNTFFLYYIGADGNRSTDGGPRHRALGVATSSDGIHFTKYSGNPILTYLPHNNEEEGIFSAGAFLDNNGEIVLYYSALDAGSPTSTTVDSDVRLAVSSDGLHFSDKGDVLSHADSKVWGYGDELFPLGTFKHNGTWHVYYTSDTKGYNLGLAQGPARNNISNNTQRVLNREVWGGCDPMFLSASKIALFVWQREPIGIEVRTASVNSPQTLSSPVETYPSSYGGCVYLDAALGPVYTCPYCGATFSSQAELDAHIASEHRVTCPQCHSLLEITPGKEEGEWGDWGSYGNNLLANPGAETGNFSGWIVAYGDPRISSEQVHSGRYSFGGAWTGAESAMAGGKNSELYQNIDLSKYAAGIDSGGVSVLVGGWYQATELAEIIVEYRDNINAVIAKDGKRVQTGDRIWRKWEKERTLPFGTRKIRIRLFWTRWGRYIDSHWDDLFIQIREREFIPKPTKDLYCPICGTYIGKGESIKLISEGDIITQLRKDIDALKIQIAEVKTEIANMRLEIEEIKAKLGME